MQQRRAPLICRDADDRIARVRAPLAALHGEVGTVNAGEFLGHVTALASLLPDASYVLNLCENRYLFMVGFCAAIVRGQTNLLAPNKTLGTQEALLSRYQNAQVLHDGVETIPGCHEVNVNGLSLRHPAVYDIPEIDLVFPAAITFTSGSTGDSKPNLKSWATFVESTEINARYMLLHDDRLVSELATVPGQHMWGMETSILLPLMRRVCVSDTQPLFPQDICKALFELPAPRLLVSTPFHLRAIMLSGLTFPPVDSILCATAPLSQELARDVESAFSGKLQEIYGCSEAGSMSCRSTSESDIWTIFSGVHFNPDEHGYWAVGEHLPASILLQDRLDKLDDRHFRLLGRSDDMIEIGGKRGSLLEMNKILQNIPGVVDGAIFLPDEEKLINRLVAAVVLAPGISKDTISTHFRQRVDPVFVPRPIHVVASLPREPNGKLPRAKLLALLRASPNIATVNSKLEV